MEFTEAELRVIRKALSQFGRLSVQQSDEDMAEALRERFINETGTDSNDR